VRYFAPSTGLDLVTNSEAPAGAGISGSSTLIIALAAAFNKLTNAGHKLEKLREIGSSLIPACRAIPESIIGKS
jgi:D-glycero-alpha-D-manno-heptose-7-phosphate kinase